MWIDAACVPLFTACLGARISRIRGEDFVQGQEAHRVKGTAGNETSTRSALQVSEVGCERGSSAVHGESDLIRT